MPGTEKIKRYMRNVEKWSEHKFWGSHPEKDQQM